MRYCVCDKEIHVKIKTIKIINFILSLHTIIQNSGESIYLFIFEDINNFIQKGC